MKITRRTFLAGAGVVLATPITAHDRVHEIEIKDFAFAPDHLVVRIGDHIRFTNLDLAPHTATAVDGSWDTTTIHSSETTELTVTSEWTETYFCAFHPNMTATLVIERE